MGSHEFPPFLVKRRGAMGARYFWQPSTKLRAEGWRPRRVPDNWASYHDPNALELAAIAAADKINTELRRAQGAKKAQLAP